MEGLNSKNEKSVKKMTWPNMALTNMDKRRPNLVFKREKTVERERRRGKERRREEEEKKRRRGQAKQN